MDIGMEFNSSNSNETLSSDSSSFYFSCDKCEKAFSKQSSLARHKYEHSASSGECKAIKELLNAGAEINAQDKDGLTDINAEDRIGATPLHYAATFGSVDACRLILNYGAFVDSVDFKGRSVMHCAASKGNFLICKSLYEEFDADLWKRNAKGELPLHEAVRSGKKDEDENMEEDIDNKVSNKEEQIKVKPNTYIVPKINPVEYEFEKSENKAKKEEYLEKAKKRAASTAIIKEFRDQYDEEGAPEEINELSVGRRKSIKQNLEKDAYEENYFMRLAEKKKQRNSLNDNLLTINTLGDNLTHFQDVSVLNENDAEAYAERKKSGKKKKNTVKLPKKIARKLAKRSKKRSLKKRINL
ncbi:hypothetical protein RND71_043655 [Anisodus tanguticus]|uniref:C2H2-type domain-containing protein n=1 Tax=Anisodus tanguticus TaxID=243964 RepID=A0AAE1QQC1_9SOLA|nr:hypothetical protein RND71_043655 [Anisodus tanguticus]